MEQWDALGVAVSAVRYYYDMTHQLSESLEIIWFVERHPCDGSLYLSGIRFVNDQGSLMGAAS